MGVRDNRLIKSAFERIVDEFKQAGQRFNMSTRPYYSSGAFIFDVVDTITDAPVGSGLTRLVLRARANQSFDFFSYGIGDDIDAVNLGGSAQNATDIDTNIVEKTNTNNEDMAIEGVSCTSRGIAVEYTTATDWNDVDFQDVLLTGGETIEDPGATLLPPETCSPLVLEDLLFRAMSPKCLLRFQWSRKEGDYLGTVDQMAEGGGKSYLRSNGEPTPYDFFRVPEGWIWRREGAPVDTILTITAKLMRDVWVVVTLPNTFPVIAEKASVSGLQRVRLAWKLRLHGRALFLPSQNV